MATSSYGIARLQTALKVSKLPPQDQQNPVRNNNQNSSVNDTYTYNPAANRATEPVVTSASGTQSSKPVEPQPNYESRVTKLQERLNIATRPQRIQAVDKGNLEIAKEQQNMQDVNYKEIIPYLQQQADKDFNKMATYSGISRLGAALSGANAEYQKWWG